MKPNKIRHYLIGLLIGFGFSWAEQVQALPFEPVAIESLPQEFTIRNFFSWSHKLWGLAQSLRGAQYIDSSDAYLQEQGAAFIQSAQNEFKSSRAWASYRSWFPPVNWLLNADFRNPWHVLALATTTGLTVYGAYYAIKKLRERYRAQEDQVPPAHV